jgi:Ca2+:H+ antiporter
MRSLNLLLIFVPASVVLRCFFPEQQALVFAASGLAIVPLAGMMGRATEELTKRMGPQIGGLLNATFGNATELIIALFALNAGLYDVVKASITGSIVGNILLVLGLSAAVGGWKREEQRFSTAAGATNASMMLLAVIALMVPALFVYSTGHGPNDPGPHALAMSVSVAVVLIVIYAAGLLFSLLTHRRLFEAAAEHEPVEWPARTAGIVLLGSTILVALESHYLVGSIEAAQEALHINPLFIGLIIVPIIGNAAEHASAVVMAAKDKMDVSVHIALGSSTQIALLIAPLLVVIGLFVHPPGMAPMSFVFYQFELIVVGLSVAIANFIAQDGKTTWLEGVQLLGAYAIVALAFFFIPPAS